MPCSPWSRTERATRRRCSGQGMTEYVIALMLVVILLAIPWGNQPAPAVQLMRALQTFYTHYSATMSLA